MREGWSEWRNVKGMRRKEGKEKKKAKTKGDKCLGGVREV